MGIGQDLLDVPFDRMVQNLAFAVAKGQLELDRSSIETARMLATEEVSLIPEMVETLYQEALPGVEVETPELDADGNPTGSTTKQAVMVPKVKFDTMPEQRMTLLQAGLMPTFYQFTETVIEVKISISMRTSQSAETSVGAKAEAKAGWGWGSAAFSSSVNYKTSNTYSYEASGASLLRTTLKPVPPPNRLMPRIVTVNLLDPANPQVSLSE